MIVLASRSPQRRGLLTALGVSHRVVTSAYSEDLIPGVAPHELVAAHAQGKAEDVAARVGIPNGGAVLGADTIVAIDGLALGKPRDGADAAAMLHRLSGRTHTVLTAVCLLHAAGVERFVASTDVTFRPLTSRHVEWYLKRGEWQGRAGAYAIQGAGAGFVAGIEGDQTNVIGLPVAALVDTLERIGLAPWSGDAASP